MIALTLAAAVALPAQWNAWKWSAPITPSRGSIQSVTVPANVTGEAQADLSDLRIIDAKGGQLPYAVLIRRGSRTVRWKEARLDDYGFLPGRFTEVVADPGTPNQDYTALDVSTTRSNFTSRVDVYASDDRRRWRRIRRGAPIYDYQADGLGSYTRITISPSHSRYYRIDVQDSVSPFPIDGVRFAQGAATLPELNRYRVVRTTVTQRGDDTIVVSDTGHAHMPVSFVRIDTATPRFSRDLTVESSDDGTNWIPSGNAEVERTPHHERRSLTFDETQGRYWRVTIANGNDAPLRAVRLELWGVPRHVVFAAQTAPANRLLYGNAGAQAPKYDFLQTHSAQSVDAAVHVGLGEPARNDRYAPPQRPWSESHAWIMWAALAVAVAGVAGLAVRVLVTEDRQAA